PAVPATAFPRSAMPGKRALDVLVATAVLLVFAPLMVLTAIAVKLFDGGPVLFRQDRVGRDGEIFPMLKFRSMVVGAESMVLSLRGRNAANGLLFKVHDDPRVTAVGRVIRRWSIDELPQLFNVLRGEMSLVGPRPLPVRPEDFEAPDHHRHTVRPGITGYWQVAPRGGLAYREMIQLDLAYIEGWSLLRDLRVLVRTLPVLVRGCRSRGC
ncbi:MAG: sugar transferase, partial [Acidimicrobiales bacterium]